jgi:hypothetical protein
MSWFGGKKKDSAPIDTSADKYQDNAGVKYQSQLSNLESELNKEKEKMLVQNLLLKLSDISVEQCITKPGSSLSQAEQACIISTINKYFEATEYVVGRVTR